MNHTLCNVALAVPLRTTFTYKVPDRLAAEIQPGSRVVVPFRKKSLVGVVTEWAEQAPPDTKLREIQKSLDPFPALTPSLLKLGRWISSYYVAPIGEVYRAMLPPLVELRAQQTIVLTEAGRAASSSLFDESTAGANLFQKLRDANAPLSLQAVIRAGAPLDELPKLQRRGLVEIRQQIQNRQRRTQKIIAWKNGNVENFPPNDKEERLKQLLTSERGPLPLPLLLKLAGVSRAVLERMLREGKLEAWDEALEPADEPFDTGYTPPAHVLNPEQESAFRAIRARFELGEFGVLLLHGVTGSGKTAIVLVPEIALTLWIGRQCRAWFGARFEGVAVLHSALSDIERAREWWRVRNREARVIVGTRSAIFAPVEKLGLVIVDEEQESSYKQEETPRYHGRDVAIVRAKLENAAALLGSATPSLET